jgi:hypothetical protein
MNHMTSPLLRHRFHRPATQTVTGIDQIRRGFVKRDEIAWIGSHRHAPGGDQIYVASYLFKYAVDLPSGTREVGLPANERIRILAATAVNEPASVAPATRIYAPDLNDPKASQSRTPLGQRGRSGG